MKQCLTEKRQITYPSSYNLLDQEILIPPVSILSTPLCNQFDNNFEASLLSRSIFPSTLFLFHSIHIQIYLSLSLSSQNLSHNLHFNLSYLKYRQYFRGVQTVGKIQRTGGKACPPPLPDFFEGVVPLPTIKKLLKNNIKKNQGQTDEK